ncbi:hypothetical protein [Streptomyces sp. NPDC050164]
MQVTGGDGVRMAFETVGGGLPLVLLPGFFGDRTTTRTLPERCSAGRVRR